MHLLATKAQTLDEADEAIDLGQTPAEVVVLSFSDSDLSAAAAAWQRKSSELPTLRLASLKRLKHPLSIDLYIDSVVTHARAVIVLCWRGAREGHSPGGAARR
jgi:cobaltochelatase CobN